MKQAVIQTGGKQYLVQEGGTLEVELIKDPAKTVSFVPLMVIDGDKTEIGQPSLDKNKVTAEVVEADVQGEKVTAIRYKPKKRVRKIRGHRQRHTILKVTKIA
ncbi:MAG TPA: 50S ribosomal protein L21 [Candidatus Saccharimonadales bacterium]|nr:50S ribosomal protein L21 [Candidatus Saccharimonadales bacterium]